MWLLIGYYFSSSAQPWPGVYRASMSRASQMAAMFCVLASRCPATYRATVEWLSWARRATAVGVRPVSWRKVARAALNVVWFIFLQFQPPAGAGQVRLKGFTS